MELRHAVLNYLKVGEYPVYVELPPALLVYGVHGMISNISKDRRWIRYDQFMIAEEVVHRKAGEKIPSNFMEGWLAPRDADPQAFEEIIVIQHPSATVDEIIAAWEVEDLSRRFPCVVLQRDLQSGALSSRARAACFALHVLTAWVGPGMAPVVQLADTDFSFPSKQELETAKWELTRHFGQFVRCN